MTGEHFTEFLDTISMSTRTSVRQMLWHLGFTETQIYKYKKQGIPVAKAGLVCHKFKQFYWEYRDKYFEPVKIPTSRDKYKKKKVAS